MNYVTLLYVVTKQQMEACYNFQNCCSILLPPTGFGNWLFQNAYLKGLPLLRAFDDLLRSWEKIRSVLITLASKTTVFLMPQSRFRYATLAATRRSPLSPSNFR